MQTKSPTNCKNTIKLNKSEIFLNALEKFNSNSKRKEMKVT